MTDVETIAKSLTKAQTEVIVKVGYGRRRAIDFSGTTAAAMRFPTARRPALTDRDITRNHGRRTAWYRLSEAGLAIYRAHLSESQS